MAKGDLSVVGGASVTPVLPFRVQDRTSSSASATHKAGEPLKQNAANYALLCATGDPEQGTDAFIGLAHNESTETATADGKVDAEVAVPFITRIRGKATTVANIDTDAELLGLEMDAVSLDLTAGVFTIDENEGDDPNVHGFVIVNPDTGDLAKGMVDVYVKPLATLFGNAL